MNILFKKLLTSKILILEKIIITSYLNNSNNLYYHFRRPLQKKYEKP